MIGTPITIKNHDTGAEIVLNDHVTDAENVIALQSFPTFESDIRSQNQARLGAHGEFHLPTYYSGMSIIFQGVIAADDEATAWGLKKELDQIMSLPRTGYPAEYTGNDTFPPMFRNTLRLTFTTPNGQEVFIDATPIKAVSYDRPLKQSYMLNFQVVLRANVSHFTILDEEPNIVAGTLGSIVTGFQLPTELPFSLSEQIVQNPMTVTMTDAGYAIVTLNGSDDGVIVNPKITNLTNGTFTRIRRPLGSAAESFIIDGIYQTMKDEDGASVQQYSDGDFIYLNEGENILVYTADAIIPN